MERINLFESPHLWSTMGPALRPGGLELTRALLEQCIILPPKARILDIGCGRGTTVAYLENDHGIRAVGMDLSSLVLASARKTNPGLSLVRGDSLDLPFAGESMDGIFMECVLSLVAEPSLALDQCREVLRPGGYLAVSDIYTRSTNAEPLKPDLGFNSCLGGATDRASVIQRVTDAGFTLVSWEDRTDLLKQLAARLVFAFGSMNAFWSMFCQGTIPQDADRIIRGMRPGYYSLVARRN
ncbi:MAG: methyltransferase domain-containing protein [Pseudomonadota bacterium]